MTAPVGHGPSHPAGAQDVGPADLLAFACELALLALLAVAGWRLGSALGDGGLASVVIAVGLLLALPAVAVVVWGRWLARTTSHRLRQPWRLVVQAALFLAAGVLATAAGLPGWGVGVAVVGVVAFVLTRRS